MISWLPLLFLFTLVSAFPLVERGAAGHTSCGKFDTIPSGESYTLFTNLWGESTAISGSQCSTLHSVEGDTVKWSTKWTWNGRDSIKSFSNIQLNKGINRQLSTITRMPSTWEWTHRGSGDVVADIAYDLFTSYSPGGSNVHELMIWLANFNAGPISDDLDADGQPVPIATNLNIAGHTWNLHKGSNGHNGVFSFLLAHGTINSFKGDIYGFFKYLIDNGHIKSSEYLITAQAGTEATCGNAVLETTAYSLSVN